MKPRRTTDARQTHPYRSRTARTIAAILAHYGTVAKAYDALQMQDTVSLPEFYRVMQGKECPPAVAGDIALAWRGRGVSPERLGAAVEAFKRKLGTDPSDSDAADAMRSWLQKQEAG